MTDKRDQMMAIRLTKAERAAIDDAAERCAMGSTTFARFILLNSIGVAPANVYVKKGKAKNRKLQKAASALTALAMCFTIGCGDAAVGELYSAAGGSAGSAGAGGAAGGSAGSGGAAGSAGATSESCWADTDADGFGAGPMLERPSCDASTSLVDNDLDCYNDNGIAYPGYDGRAQEFDRGDGSFDYDCDGLETPEHPISDCANGISGWWFNDIPPPDCGELGNWRECGAESFLQKAFQACS